MEKYLVGGAVRDRLLGLAVTERDWVVVGASPEDMIEAGYTPVGRDFPVFLHPETHEEYALARTERKTAPGYHGFTFHTDTTVTLEEDLKRRDLTINAMAQTTDGRLIDPYGGQSDLEHRWLRHVSPAFTEDPVRILRVARLLARFEAFGFRIAAETMQLMRSMVDQGEAAALVPERVWQELQKALQAQHPRACLETLRQCGALAVVMPELDNLFGVPQRQHLQLDIDSGLHTLMALDRACVLTNDAEVRFAVICHDFGKACTPPAQWPVHPNHEQVGLVAVETLCARLRVPTRFRELALLVTRFHAPAHRAHELTADEMTRILHALDVLRKPVRFEQFLQACAADALSWEGSSSDYLQAELLRGAANAVRTVDAGQIARRKNGAAAIAQAVHQARVTSVQHYLDAVRG